MGVGVHGERKRRVPEHLHHDPGRNALGKEEACHGMTAVVQPGMGDAEAGATRNAPVQAARPLLLQLDGRHTMASAPVFSSVWAGVPLSPHDGLDDRGRRCIRVSKTTLPVASRRMKVAAAAPIMMCLVRCVCNGVASPTSMTVSRHAHVIVLEDHSVVSR